MTTTTAHGLSLGQEVQILEDPTPLLMEHFQVRQINSATSFTVIAAYNTSHLSATGGAVSTWQVFTRVNTTVSTVTQNGSLLTITPASMTNIVVGMVLFDCWDGWFIVVVSGTTCTFSLSTTAIWKSFDCSWESDHGRSFLRNDWAKLYCFVLPVRMVVLGFNLRCSGCGTGE